MLKRNVSVCLFLIGTSFLFSSCIADLFGIKGKGSIVTNTISAKDFQSVQLLTSADVTIVKDTAFKVEVDDYENIVQYTSAKVVSHNLIISINPVTTILSNSQAKVRISMPDSLIGLTITGSGNIDVNAAFKDVQTLLVTGSGSINLNSSSSLNKLSASILGSGGITALGTANTLTAIISGSGNMNFRNLIANDATCTITGSGNINVTAVNTLKATISGSGNIMYSGSPTITQTITGSGNVIKN